MEARVARTGESISGRDLDDGDNPLAKARM